MIKYMAVAVAVAVSGCGAVAVAVPVAGLTKRSFDHIQKRFLNQCLGLRYLDYVSCSIKMISAPSLTVTS